MGRMLEALKQETRLPREKPFFDDSLEREPHAEALSDGDDSVPFIEVGGPNKKVEGSPQVMMAVKHPPQPKTNAPHIVPEKKTLPTKAELLYPEPLAVSFEPWPSLPRLAQGIAPEIVVYHHPDHAVSQQYAGLANKMREAGCQTQLLVGSRPHVGTSTVLLNLGVAAARMDHRRVVLVDAHLRRPGLAQRLGYGHAAGLHEVLLGKLAIEQAVVATAIDNLHLLPAQASAVSPTLSAEAVRWLLSWLRDRFDLVLVDGPALDTGGELACLAPACEGTYLVIPQGENGPMQRTQAHTLSTIGARLRGLIHTQCDA